MSQFLSYCAENEILPINNENIVEASNVVLSKNIKTSVKKIKDNILSSSIIPHSDYNYNLVRFKNEFGITQEYYSNNDNSKDSFCIEGQYHIIKSLYNNQYKILATIDLHNKTQDNAINILAKFLASHDTYNKTCLLIIHGKGLNSEDGKAILKHATRSFLEFYSRTLAYSRASNFYGGDGVTLVKLKNKHKP